MQGPIIPPPPQEKVNASTLTIRRIKKKIKLPPKVLWAVYRIVAKNIDTSFRYVCSGVEWSGVECRTCKDEQA